MHAVVTQAVSRLTVFAVFLITVVSSMVRAHQQCGQEDLVRCAQPLQVLTDSGLTFVASKKDLEIICPDLRAGLKCVHSYTSRCMNLQQRTHFKKLFHGTSSMVKELCNNGAYQEEYLKYAPCMREVVDQNEVCFKRYQATMESLSRPRPQAQNPNQNQTHAEQESPDDGIKSVCCSFHEYVECSTHTMRRACGDDAARFSRGFLDKMASSMIKMHCSEYTHGSVKCGFSSAISVSSSLYSVITLALLHIFSTIVR